MRPRVVSWYEHRLGRNDGNPLYVTNCLKRDYADRLEFHHLIPDPALPRDQLGRFDLHLWIDWGEDALAGVLPYAPLVPGHPSAYWASDTHLGPAHRFRWARHFDHVFFAQRKAVETFGGGEWLPHAVEPQAYNPAAQYAPTTQAALDLGQVHRLKRWDLGFVGHLNDPTRVAALDRLFREFPESWWGSMRTGRVFERAADVYTQARICFNHAIQDDVNMRVFEVLATRSFLLTPAVDSLDALFTDGVHLATYRDLDDCVDKARYYLAHDDARERIAAAGYAEVLAKHTIAHRVRRMLTVAGLAC
jgi:hypothetical protein